MKTILSAPAPAPKGKITRISVRGPESHDLIRYYTKNGKPQSTTTTANNVAHNILGATAIYLIALHNSRTVVHTPINVCYPANRALMQKHISDYRAKGYRVVARHKRVRVEGVPKTRNLGIKIDENHFVAPIRD